MTRPRALSVVLAVAVALSAALPRAAEAEDAPPLRASIICEAPPAPGRFRCDVEVRVSGASISWADVVVVKVDDFILPLRGRLGPREASTHEADIFRWSLGFVAKGRGAGDVTLRVRAVVCHDATCGPVGTEVAGHVVVGR
jgi:hypothetical protein